MSRPAAATDGSPTTSSLRSSYSDDTSSCSFFSSSSSSSSSSSDSGIPEWGEVPLVVPSPAAGSDGLCRIGDSEFSGLRGSSRTTSLLAWPAAEGKLKSSVELSSLRLHRGAISVSNGQKLILRDCGMDECRVSVGDGAELVLERCKWTSGLRPAVHVCWSTAPVDTPPRIEINDCHFSDMHVAVSLELEAFPSTDGVQQRTIPPDSVPTVGLHHCTFTDIRGAAIVVAVHIRSPLAADQTDSSDKDSVYHFNLSTLMVADESSLSYERCPARFEVSFGGSKLLRPFSFSSWPPPSGEYLTPRRGSSGRGAQQVKAVVSADRSRLEIVCPPVAFSSGRKRAGRKASSSQVSVWMETLGLSDEDINALSREAIMSAFRKRSLSVHPDKRGASASPGSTPAADNSSPEDFISLVEARDGLLQCLASRRDTAKRSRRRR